MLPERIRISDRISYWKATEVPLSADIGVVEGDECVWVFDVGNSTEALECIRSITKSLNLVLSHFHKDHIGNVKQLDENIYQGAHTLKYTHFGEVVHGDIWIEDGAKIHLFEIPSGHAKGCIGMEVDEEYAFLGDAIYCTMKEDKQVYNANLLAEQIKVLRTLKAKYFLLSHRERFVCKKEVVLRQLESIYAMRDAKCAWIVVKK